MLALIIIACCFGYVAMGLFIGAYSYELMRDKGYHEVDRSVLAALAGGLWMIGIMVLLCRPFLRIGERLATASLDKQRKRLEKQKRLRIAIRQAEAEIEKAEAELDTELRGGRVAGR